MDIRTLHQAWASGQIDGTPLPPQEAAQRAALPIEQFISQVVPSHPQLRAILEMAMARSTGMSPTGSPQAMAQQFGGGGMPGPFTSGLPPGAPPMGPMGGVSAYIPPGMAPAAPPQISPSPMTPLPPRAMPGPRPF